MLATLKHLSSSEEKKLQIILNDIKKKIILPKDIHVYCDCDLPSEQCVLCYKERLPLNLFYKLNPVVKETLLDKKELSIKSLTRIYIYPCLQKSLMFETDLLDTFLILTKLIEPKFQFIDFLKLFEDKSFLKVLSVYNNLPESIKENYKNLPINILKNFDLSIEDLLNNWL